MIESYPGGVKDYSDQAQRSSKPLRPFGYGVTNFTPKINLFLWT